MDDGKKPGKGEFARKKVASHRSSYTQKQPAQKVRSRVEVSPDGNEMILRFIGSERVGLE
jgi:hypothetical protein